MMKITNKLGLPSVFVKIAENTTHSRSNNNLSATTLLLPAQEIVLRQRFNSELQQDVSDMFNLFIGTALHDFIEKHDDSPYSEKYVYHYIGDQKITGKIDNYNEKTYSVIDYKTAKVSTVTNSNFSDWEMQGKIYAWLLVKNGIWVEDIKFYAILKDWSAFAKKFKGEDYPQEPVYLFQKKITADDLREIETFIVEKSNAVLKMKQMTTKEILEQELPSEFKPVVKYALMKKGSKKALSVNDDKEYADWYASRHEDVYVEERHESNMKYDMVCTAHQLAKLKEE